MSARTRTASGAGVGLRIAASASLLAGVVSAQTFVGTGSTVKVQGRSFVLGSSGELIESPVPNATAPAAGAQAPSAPPTARLEALKKLEFDRRPSAILAAWSTPPKPPEEDKTASAASSPGAPATSSDASAAAQPPAATPPGVTVTGGVVTLTPAIATGAPAAPAASGAIAAAPSVPAAPATSATPPAAAGATPATGVGAASAPAGAPAEPAKAPTEEDAAKAKAAADEAKKKADAEAERKAAEAKALQQELATFQRSVTLGDWATVKSYLATLTEDERKTGYERMLQSLAQGPQQRPNVPPQGQMYVERNRFAPDDVVGIAAAAPLALSKEHLASLGQLLRQALDQGHQLEQFLAEMRPHVDEEGFAPNRRQLALMLVAANEPLGLEGLIPTAQEAETANDREGLNLVSRFCAAKYEKDKKLTWLEQAWAATQAVLAVGEVDEKEKKEAIQRAVDIAPRIQKELGQAWLDESFTARPERGMEILAAIGSSSSTALAAEPMNSDKRSKLLELQTTAAKALLASAPERATEWKDELALLALNWLREAQVTYQYDDSVSLSPRMQRDNYGNYYYWDMGGMRNSNAPSSIRTSAILDMRPSEEWLARLDDTLRPRFQMVFAQLLLKVGEEARAFPYIEGLAASLPRQAKDLVDEFLRVWTKNHDPNVDRNRGNPYIFMYGFEERANGIPLTRSKQERNLRELGEWVARLRKLPVELDDELLANAFTTVHSSAEVYRLETIEEIFGPIAELAPATLAELVQKMRTNLVTVWRDPALQQDKKTNRKPQDIQAEVLRGYELARTTIAGALEDHPESWELWLAQAALEHDENDYRGELSKDPEFAVRRQAAFATFRKAADLYAAQVDSLEREKETTKVYDTWFYAALGACDLKAIDAQRVLAADQIPLIRDAIAALPGERAERHTAMFASALFTRMSSASPAVKFRYLREGLSIAGDHKLTREARQVFDYYKDLVTEIQLRARVDGGERVGHGEPFGLAVDIRHTKEIERESGGFSKYLQNQNSQNFGWNYGRPLEDYRDKFEEAARQTLQEHFEVLSVTFNEPETRSKADPEYGWRVTPYAYLLLKPRGPQVDRIPPLRLDLDFLDVTGYAVLPVESPAVAIDASADAGDERPFEKLALTQTLDERQAKDGKLILEVKGAAHGLVPALESVLDFAPEGFDVAQRDDHGVAVVKFDESGSGILSERTWTLTLRPREGLPHAPETFSFGKPRAEGATSEQFRYVDADLASVEPTISLENRYGAPDRRWMWWIPAALAVAAGGFLGWRRMQRPRIRAQARFQVPEPLTPFTVLGLLRDIESNDGLAPDERRELGVQIQSLERHYFVEEGPQPPDLRHIAERWVESTSSRTDDSPRAARAVRASRAR